MPHTRESLETLLPIIQAFVEGKVIQYLDSIVPSKHWRDTATPSFAEGVQYRIKPDTVRYRLCVMQYGKTSPRVVFVAPSDYNATNASGSFVRWVGEEQEIEV